jgi:N-acetylglucosamine-6-phosphate deacetylase
MIAVMSQRTLLSGGRIVTTDARLDTADVLVEDGCIGEVGTGFSADDTQVVDVTGLVLAPGFIDIHVHGGGGHSLITTRAGEVAAYDAWAPRNGVTSYVATLCTADIDSAIACLRVLAARGPGAAMRDANGANFLGVNLEGPFVSSERRGALPPSWPLAPDAAALKRLLDAADGTLRLITVAPELPGALDVIREAVAAGLRVSVGHTDATYEHASAGFAAGATQLTHAFNAMRPFHHRDPGPIGAAIEAGAIAEVIADGVHLHPATVRTLVRAFGPERVALITDGVTPAGLGEGTFRIGEHEATLRNGEMRLPDGTIAGGVATMIDVVRNVVRWGIVDLATACTMASATPARALGLGERKGRIAPGYDADLVALTEELSVAQTWAGGQRAYASP